MGEGLYDSVATFKARAYERVAVERLGPHLAERYGVDVVGTAALDGGVYRVDLLDGRRWVARLFPRARPMAAVRGDAEVLDLVAGRAFPAERCVSDPVSEHEGQGVLVTEWVEGVNGRGQERPALFRTLGALLGELHSIVPTDGHAARRPAGSWHSLSIEGGGREADVRHLRSLLADAASSSTASAADERSAFDALDRELEALDVGDGLPTALTHPDFCSANAVLGSDGGVVLVDWTGAGTAPRLTSLGLLLSSTGGASASVDAVMSGYASAGAMLEAAELDRLEDAVVGFGFVLACWGVVYFGTPASQVVSTLAMSRTSVRSIVDRTRQAVGA
jgi:Ser/Thr protein kinase RdoA (MazF antagonist)